MKPLPQRGFDKATVRSALSAHAAIGIVVGALLYLVCLTGSVLVFYAEWQRIEQPAAPEMAAMAPEAVQRGVEAMLARDKAASKAPTGHMFVYLPRPDLPRATITTDHGAMHLRPDGSIAVPEEKALSEFLLILHYTFHLPSPWGITLVGGLGAMIVALSLSGVVAHPRIFRDAFRLRVHDTGGVGLADWHNRIGVWTLPFTLAIALTGAMIGMATVNAYGIAARFYKGDFLAVYAPIFGSEGRPDRAPGAAPDVAASLRGMATRFPDSRPYLVILDDPATVGQQVHILALPPRRLIYGENYAFDADGRYKGKAGLSDGTLGQQMTASAYNLHFGNYGGLPVKIAYALFGIAMTGLCATGVSIWLAKRRRRGLDHPRMAAAWDGLVWGAPVALILCFLLRQWLGNGAPLVAAFWGSLAAIIFAGPFAGDARRFARALQALLGLGLVAGGVGFVLAL
jgi:uncharacterized iron-regulated membrane protein